MHDITILWVATQDVRDNLTESLWEDSLVDVLDGVMYVFLRGTDTAHHISVISHLILNYQLKLNLWCFLRSSLCLELIHLGKAEDTGKDVLGERTNLHIIGLDSLVVLIACLVDAVLCSLQLYLQVTEVLVSFQVRIVLLNGNQATESTAQFTLCLLEPSSFSGVSVEASRLMDVAFVRAATTSSRVCFS